MRPTWTTFRKAFFGCCVAVLWLSRPECLHANIGPKWHGDIAADPQGLIGVNITHEKLTIDLRPIAALQPAEVEAVYMLENAGTQKKLDLLFVSGAPDISNFAVNLNGQAVMRDESTVDARPGAAQDLVERWRIPYGLPGIHGHLEYYGFPLEMSESIQPFSIVLPPGASTLTARYRARACGAPERGPMATWLFPYTLAPARSWASFGGLEVTVFVPEGWESNSGFLLYHRKEPGDVSIQESWELIRAPALEREGHELRGNYPDLPADVLCVAVRAPEPPDYQRTAYWCGWTTPISLAGGAVFCCCIGLAVGRGLPRKYPAIVQNKDNLLIQVFYAVAIVVSLLWASVIFNGALFGYWIRIRALGGQESPYFAELGHQTACIAATLALGALPVGFGLTCVSAFVGRKCAIQNASATGN